MSDISLQKITKERLSLFKIIDEYRELIEFIQNTYPDFQVKITQSPWIKRIMLDQDLFLHQLLALSPKEKVIRIRKFPLQKVQWEIANESGRSREKIQSLVSKLEKSKEA